MEIYEKNVRVNMIKNDKSEKRIIRSEICYKEL